MDRSSLRPLERERYRFPASPLAVAIALLLSACGDRAPVSPRVDLVSADTRLTLEAETDDLIHFELAPLDGATPAGAAIPTSPMIAPAERHGPRHSTSDGHGGLATATLAISVDPTTLCIAVRDARKGGRPRP